MARGFGGRMHQGGRNGGRTNNWKDVLTGESSGSKLEIGAEDKHNDDTSEADEGFYDDFGTASLNSEQIEEILYLNPSDHPGMQLVAVPLNGMNFITWSRSIRRALGARSKLELVDGTMLEPSPNSKHYKQWLRTDYMISSWILNSISKEVVNGFSHIDSTKKLWDALNHRFGRCNGPNIYKLQREITGYVQGTQTVVQYFNNLNALWDELDTVLPPLNCVCDAKNKFIKREEQQKLMKFLHGLNSVYDSSKNQILLLDSLPHVDKAYAMIIQVEDELALSNVGHESHQLMAMYITDLGEDQSTQSQFYAAAVKTGNFKRRPYLTKEEKRRLKCKYCNETGHEAEECFKLHGVPDWYKRYKEGLMKQQANYVDNGEDADSTCSLFDPKSPAPDISKLVQVEVARYLGAMNTQMPTPPPKNELNL